MPFSSEHHLLSAEIDSSDVDNDHLVVMSFSGTEGMSQLFRFEIDLLCNSEIPFDKAIGSRIMLTMPTDDEGGARWFHGMISEIGSGRTYQTQDDDGTPIYSYRVVMVPRMWTMTRNTNCRVWENKTANQIIQDVFGANDPAEERTHEFDFEFANENETHPELVYTVQYYESDFEFVSRIMEEQGYGYFFRHDPDHDHLVIFDTSNELPDLVEPYDQMFIGSRTADGIDNQIIDSWKINQVLAPGCATFQGYDFTNPTDSMPIFSFSSLQFGGNEKYEIFDHPSNYTATDDTRYADYRIQAEEAASHLIEGRGKSAAFEPGCHFTLNGEHAVMFEGDPKYLIIQVEHFLTQSLGHETGQGETSYENYFRTLPFTIPYRARETTEKPSVHGTETAVVVGPDGEEIKTDEWGRIRIQFHWDREERDNAGDNVCWSRVAQSLAGTGWGAIYTPRIGQEVVVTFLQGDPDRPLVTGVVYNGTHKVPYTLDENKTQSGIKTRSSMKGTKANYNELRFEDKKGSEEILIHAERNFTISVEADRAMTIGANESTTVEGKEERVVNGDDGQKLTVTKGDHVISVEKGDSNFTVGKGSHNVTVKTDQIIGIEGTQETEAKTEMKMKSPKVGFEATEKFRVNTPDFHSVGATTVIEGDAGTMTIDASTVTISVGGSTVTVKDGEVSIEADAIKLNG